MNMQFLRALLVSAFSGIKSGYRSGTPERRRKSAKSEPRGIVPKAFRQYAKRYGRGVDELQRAHLKYPAPLLDHWRDRRAAFRKALGMDS